MGFPQLSNIDKRIYDTIQSKAGKNLRASQTMPWIRVISCLGDFLAIESSKESESFAQKYGDTGKSGRLGKNKNGHDVYGNTSTDRGLRSSPSIDSISISQGNEGLSKKSSFTIICYSLGQCEKIMEYFLEPGNMVLVEWGENNHLSTGQKATPISTCEIAAYNSLKHIQTKRKRAEGMYDAVLGVITGGSMSYGSNETFEINVELTSVGELPAYLQHHKGISVENKNFTSSDKYDVDVIDTEANVGKRLFQQMYNDLPAIKRTATIKALINNDFATDSINFINMDKEIREDLLEATTKSSFAKRSLMTKEGDIEIVSDMPLFSEKRFIRVALAFTIIDTMDEVMLDPVPLPCGKLEVQSSNGKIGWKNTICRAHKNMFSADSNYLYIPNLNTPSFDLMGALRVVTPSAAGRKASHTNPLPDLLNQEVVPNQCADLHPTPHDGGRKTAYFPSNLKLNFSDQGDYDKSYVPIEADPGTWGYLRDLYINFDFFCDTIEKAGLVTKDIFYELLNGMSSSVNLYWNFQILERGSIKVHAPYGNLADTYYVDTQKKETKLFKGHKELQIVDVSFGGNVNPKGSSVGIVKFQSRGVNSPFLSAELNFDIPGAMKGQVIGSKLAGKGKDSNPSVEDKEITFNGLFSGKHDTVLDALASVRKTIIKKEEEAAEKEKQRLAAESKTKMTPAQIEIKEAQEAKKADDEKKDAAEEQQKSNYEYFVQNSCIIPKIQDRNENRDLVNNWYESSGGSDAISLEDIVVVGTWNDPQVLKKIQMLNEGLLSAKGAKYTLSNLNVPLLPIKFNFTIHGVSGIRVGDTFNIKDLPTKYSTKVFQVTQISHDISQNIWTTKVEGSMRNMEASSADPKTY